MPILNRISEKLKDDGAVHNLIKLVLVLLVVVLIQMTTSFWKTVLSTLWNIFRPFIIGFGIAYVLRAPVVYFEEHGISKKITIPVLYAILVGLFVWLISSLFPLLLTRTTGFFDSVISSVNSITSLLPGGTPEWIREVMDTSLSKLTNVQSLISNVADQLPEFLTAAVGALIIALISVIISVFMCFEWEKMRFLTIRFTRRISRKCYECTFAINDEIGGYIRSILKLMGVRLVEYALLYFLVGHPDWLILAIASSISLIVPYVGPTIVNTIGILTALQLPTGNVIILVVLIFLLAQVDEYVIAPMMHSRNLKISPLWALFSVFAGNTLLGIAGIVIAIPCYLAIRIIIRMYFGMPDDLTSLKETEESR